ncbi:MAG: hypothetical protein CFK49_05355 [Armatimonadetes bacterium JP3_11]|jgi:hypothetical protein|nr:MAG: hypothetical protein CFK48_03525 [Armatimonadetes bacterium CP1_7O]OYT75043.1 MAG: hypothetical protein CFK49_05355 [Armatimonadetes bacterium JP3_11]RMH07632.1 MAG: hypothetical protein D6697_08130 [Armatimonadota bacterium]
MSNSLRAFGLGVLLTLGCVLGYTQIDRILKAGGIAVVVDRLGGDMDKAINRLTNTKPDKNFATKVVPIISAGNGAYIGAAQVMGKPELVRQVQAVAQVEGDFMGREVRLRALIPISTKNPQRGLSRVEGVGVSAIVDIRI